MHESLIAVQRSTNDGLAQLSNFFGFSKAMGALYGTLLLSPRPLSLTELAEAIEISKGGVSMNMQALERWGIVKEVLRPGDRQKYYEAETDLWKIVTNVLQGRERREVERALQVLAHNIEELQRAQASMTPEDQELAQFYLERVAELQSFFRFAQLVLESIVGRAALDFGEVTKVEIE